MTEQDIADVWAAMQTVSPKSGGRLGHEIVFPFDVRLALRAWQNLFLDPGPFEQDPRRDDLWNRGAYIVNGPGHCVACHTPRNALGARDRDRHLTGSKSGPGGEKVPAITRSALKAAGWRETDIAWALRTGLKPDGDSFSGSMGEVVRHSTSWLTDRDLQALATYLMIEKP
jgi:mono/diheme cytochrome c family protein